jgi:hypothetical protein
MSLVQMQEQGHENCFLYIQQTPVVRVILILQLVQGHFNSQPVNGLIVRVRSTDQPKLLPCISMVYKQTKQQRQLVLHFRPVPLHSHGALGMETIMDTSMSKMCTGGTGLFQVTT